MAAKSSVSPSQPASQWTFFTNHAHVLFCLAQNPDLQLRHVAERVGITERAAQRIVHELENDGYIQIRKEGRRNHYALLVDRPLRHPIEQVHTVQQLLEFLLSE